MSREPTSTITLTEQSVTFWWVLGDCPVTAEFPEDIYERHRAVHARIERDHRGLPSLLRTVVEGSETYELENFELCEFHFDPVDVAGIGRHWAGCISFATELPYGFTAVALHEMRALCEGAYAAVAAESGLAQRLGLVTRYNVHKVTTDEAIPFPEEPSLATVHVFVHARALRPAGELDAEDFDVDGVYEVTLEAAVPPEARANAALDGFHDRIPVAEIDDFEFIVRESARVDAPVIEEADVNSMTLLNFLVSVKRVDPVEGLTR